MHDAQRGLEAFPGSGWTMIELKEALQPFGNPWQGFRVMLQKSVAPRLGRWRLWRDLSAIRARAFRERYCPGAARLDGLKIAYRDALSFYIESWCIWWEQLYRFQLETPAAYILDCGSSIGVSVLFFRRQYPGARIVAFEPQPDQFRLLGENLRRNRIEGVEAHQVALGGADGTGAFTCSRGHGGRLGGRQAASQVPVRRLSRWIDREVDILKMNIEGAEADVLREIEPRIRSIKNLVFEYHHRPDVPPTLHEILALLHRNRFVYGINDFGRFINPSLRPDRFDPEAKYYLLVFARRIG